MTRPNAAAPDVARSPSMLRRLRQVARVFARHGLADIASALQRRRIRLFPRRSEAGTVLSRAARLRLAFEELGPTFVKFGQALSVRPDLVAPSLVAELARLQDQVTPLPAGAAEALIEASLGRPVSVLFATFDPVPHAAASMAQVHRATLPSGEQVAVKIRRPGITEIIDSDLEILRQFARLVERHAPAFGIVDLTGFVDEFARTLRREQDLAREGRQYDRFARNFSGDPTIRFPAVDWARTTSAVLTMEFLEGTALSAFITPGTSDDERRILARRGADAMLRQYLEHGWFHADPHPGNILVLPGQVIGFLDLGMVGRVDEALRGALTRAVTAIGDRDAERLAGVVLDVTEARGDVEPRALARDLAELIDAYADVAIGELSLGAVLSDAVSLAAHHQLRLPSNLMLLIKSVTTIESVGRQLDPSFRMVEHARPFAEAMWRQRHAPDVLARRAARASRRALVTAVDLPRQADALLRRAVQGRLQVQFAHRNLDHFVLEMDRSSNRLSFAIVIAAILVGSSLVIHAGGVPTEHYGWIGLTGFVIAAVLGIGLAIGIARSGRL